MLSQEKIQGVEYSKGGRVRWTLLLAWSDSHPKSTLPCLTLARRGEDPLLSFPSACWEEGQRDVGAFPQPAVG